MATKAERKALDECLQRLKNLDRTSEVLLAITKTKEAIMWLGMNCKEWNGGKSCYEHCYDPTNARVDPVADGLKM